MRVASPDPVLQPFEASWLLPGSDPTLQERRFPPSKILLALQVLAESGIDARTALGGSGLNAAELADTQTRVSGLQTLAVLTNLARFDPRPDVGLRLGQRVRASSYGMFGYALLCSATMRAVLDTTERFQRLGGALAYLRWSVKGDAVVLERLGAEGLAWAKPDARILEVMRDYEYGLIVRILKDILGESCRPSLALFTGPPPRHADAIALALECPLRFDQPGNALHYPVEWLDRSPQLANPIAAAEVSEVCARLLEELDWQSGFTRRVYHELTSKPGSFPDIEIVASALCMSSRTLRRKLEAEGTSFRNLTDDVRYALAQDYLRSPMMKIEDVTSALGFADAASFRRAYRRWSGRRPSDARG